MDEIDNTILSFEKYNNLKIAEYVSPSGRSCYAECNLKTDRYIGIDIFKQNIEKWLTLFEPEDQSIYLDLLKRYRYFPEQEIKNAIFTLAQKIKDDCSLPDFENIYFITFASKEFQASGGDNLRAYLRTELGLLNKNSLLDTSPNLSDICKRAKVIIFLDDVVGSGTTMYGRFTSLIDKLNLINYPDIKLYAVFICANEKKLYKKINDIHRNTNVTIIPEVFELLEKELSKNKLDNEEYRTHVLDVTQKYDQIIYSNKYENDNEKDCIRGFNNSQLLLSFCYNTPNNTIAAFWRPSKFSEPIFLRTTCKNNRITISELKEKQELARRNHYYCTISEKKDD